MVPVYRLLYQHPRLAKKALLERSKFALALGKNRVPITLPDNYIVSASRLE